MINTKVSFAKSMNLLTSGRLGVNNFIRKLTVRRVLKRQILNWIRLGDEHFGQFNAPVSKIVVEISWWIRAKPSDQREYNDANFFLVMSQHEIKKLIIVIMPSNENTTTRNRRNSVYELSGREIIPSRWSISLPLMNAIILIQLSQDFVFVTVLRD